MSTEPTRSSPDLQDLGIGSLLMSLPKIRSPWGWGAPHPLSLVSFSKEDTWTDRRMGRGQTDAWGEHGAVRLR